MIGSWLTGGLVAVTVLGFAGLAVQTKRLEDAKVEAAVANQVARASKATLDRLEADRKFAERISADLARVEARFDIFKTETIREIIKTPVTTECARTPAIDVALDRLRRWPDQAADGRSASAPGLGAAVPAAPGTGKPGER